MNGQNRKEPDEQGRTECVFAKRKFRADVKIGQTVNIVLKADKRTGKLTKGTVAKILTNSTNHPHGIKVMLDDGQVGRVQEIVNSEELRI